MDDITCLKSKGIFLLAQIENTDSFIESLTIQRDRRKKELTDIEKRIGELRR
jgi:hypothetical protein